MGACSNTKQGLLYGRGDLAHIHLVEPVQDLLGKQSGKHIFDKRVRNSFLVTIFLWINLNWNSFNLVSPQMFFSFGWKWKWEREYCQTSYTKTQNSGTELPKRVKPLNKCSKLHPTTQPV